MARRRASRKALRPAKQRGTRTDGLAPVLGEPRRVVRPGSRLTSIPALLLAGCGFWLVGCSSCGEVEQPIEETPIAFLMEKVSGDDQTGEVTAALEPYVVRVVDRNGRAVPGHLVHFAITDAPAGATGHELDQSTVETDDDGEASVTLTLGSWPGAYSVTATGDGNLGGSPAEFTATATAAVGPASAIAIVSGVDQLSKVGEPLANAFVVRITDEFGALVPSQMIRFEIEEAPSEATGQTMGPILVSTGADGEASSVLTLGSRPGEYQVSATVENAPALSVSFVATAIVGDAHRIEEVSGDAQSAVVTETLAAAFVVRVVDAHGNSVAGHDVTFAVVDAPTGATGHELGATTVATDSEGLAESVLTLGTKTGAYQVSAAAASVAGEPVLFDAMALTGAAFAIQGVSGGGQTGIVTSALADPFVVRVVDEHDNPVLGHEVVFALAGAPDGAAAMSLSAGAVATDAAGLASTVMTLGTRAGAYAVAATPSGELLGAPIAFTATALPGAAFALEEVSGGGQTGAVGSVLPGAFVVRVQDLHGNSVAGHQVVFAIEAVPEGGTGHALSVGTTVTSADGSASTQLTLSRKAGSHHVSATAAGGLAGSPIGFVAEAVPATAAVFQPVSGNNQTAVVGEELAAPLIVHVVDSNWNPVPGHGVTFAIHSTPAGATGQSLGQTSVTTDAAGRAETVLTLGGIVGGYSVRATADGGIYGSPITFQATAVAGPAFEMQVVSGDGQSAVVTETLADPYVVRVADQYGNAVAGHDVVFAIGAVPDGATGQALSAGSVATNASGLASTTLTLGNKFGTYEVGATAAGGLPGSPAAFFAQALVDAAHSMELVSGDGQVAVVASGLAQPLVVRVRDVHGNVVEGHGIDFSIVLHPVGATGQSSSVVSATTDVLGSASTQLTLGTKVGSYEVGAVAEGNLQGSPITFVSTAISDAAFELLEVSGADQQAVVTSQLPDPLVVGVVDQYGNAVAGHLVSFALAQAPADSAGQELSSLSATTGTDGLASTSLTLGNKPGIYEVSATATGGLAGSPVAFLGTALADQAFELRYGSGADQTAPVTEVLPTPLSVRVLDQHGNAVTGHTVSFAIEQAPALAGGHSLSAATALTDGGGLAETILQLGTKAGIYEVSATAAGLSGSPVIFTATALAGEPHLLEEISGGGQTATVTSVLSDAFVVRVLDEHGNALAGQGVTFALQSAPAGATGQALDVAQAVTDGDGLASSRLTLGTGSGSYEVGATADLPLTGSPLTFVATALPGDASLLELVSGSGQSAIVTEALSSAFVFRVLDQHGNGVPGHELAFTIGALPAGATGQALGTAAASTDHEGVASTTLTLGNKTGVYETIAASSGAGALTPVSVAATALSDSAYALEAVSGAGQTAVVTETLLAPFVVRVIDRFGNAVSGHGIEFSIGQAPAGATGQSLGVTSTISGADGLASSLLTLGTRAGEYQVDATAAVGIFGSPVIFTATAEAAVPHHIAIELQPSTDVKPDQLLDLVLTVVDSHGNPMLDWTGRIDLTLDTDPWGTAPPWADIGAGSGGSVTLPQSISFSAADEAHIVSAVSGALQGQVSIRVEPGELLGLLVEHSALGEAETGDVRVSFDLGSAWPPDGSMDIVFEAGHDLSTATLENVSGLDGTFTLTISTGNTARISRLGGAWVPSGTRVVVSLGGVVNPAAGPEGPVSVSTAIDDGRRVDVGVYVVRFWLMTSSSGHHSCGIDAAGRLWCWGEGTDGKLGNGTTTKRLIPTEVSGDHSDWIDVAAGRYHTCGLRSAAAGGATLWCWGNGGGGRLGNGATSSSPTPVEVLGGHTDWLAVSPGWQHTCALRATGALDGATLWCWGTGTSGRLGDGTTDSRSTPTEVSGAHTDWVHVAAGGAHTCGIRASGTDGAGTMWCWGEGTYGQLGHGAATLRLVPNEVPGAYGDWIRVSTDERHTCGITASGGGDSGTLWCWGDGTGGRLGADTTESHFIPNEVFGGHVDWMEVTAGNFHTCGLRSAVGGASLWCWGPGEWGRLGHGGYENKLRPTEVAGGSTDWQQVSAATWHTCGTSAVGSTGRSALLCWGNNIHGQLGLGLEWFTQHLRPVTVAVDRRTTKVSASFNHGCSLADDGTLWCWGAGANGRLASGDVFNRTTPLQVVASVDEWIDVSAGEAHTCAITGTVPGGAGRVWCWGAGGAGRLGNNDTIDAYSPVAVSSVDADWSSVSAGGAHTCGIRDAVGAGGTLWCWGTGGNGRLGNDATANSEIPAAVHGGHADWVQVSAGGAHTCGIRESGGARTLWCWGTGGSGQLGDGTSENKQTPVQVDANVDWLVVSAGSAHTCGVREVGTGGRGTMWCWGAGGNGRLGNGATSNRPTPVEVFGEEIDWLDVSAGVAHTCGIRGSGAGDQGYLWCWGSGDNGRLGTDATSMWTTPAQVFGGFGDWVQVAAANQHTQGLRVGQGWSWGSNAGVQIGDGTRFKGEPHFVLPR